MQILTALIQFFQHLYQLLASALAFHRASGHIHKRGPQVYFSDNRNGQTSDGKAKVLS